MQTATFSVTSTTHPIQRAVANLAKSWPLLAFTLATVVATRGVEQRVIDLTNATPGERRSMGVPGYSSGGVPGESADSRVYLLPVELKIKKLSRDKAGSGLSLELLLTNTGAAPLDIPTCLDAFKAHEPGTADRLTLEIGLKFREPELKSQTAEIVDVLFGSIAAHDCSVRLAPNDKLVFVATANLPADLPLQGDRISVSAYVHELKIENQRYYIEKQSREVESPPIELPNRRPGASHIH
jgi:hypothetical protein